jgi:excisionase family DNA binding protein
MTSEARSVLPAAPSVAPFGEPLVDAATVASYLSCDPATIYRIVERGELPGIVIAPRLLRFRPEDVRAFLARRTRKAPVAGRVNRLLGSRS